MPTNQNQDIPQIPLEYLDRGVGAVTDQKVIARAESELSKGPQPIAITMDAQEIGAFAVSNITPYDFTQLLLAKLKDAGGAVEGTLHLKLAHGQLYKKKSQPGEMIFTYIWLPEAYVDGLNQIGGVA